VVVPKSIELSPPLTGTLVDHEGGSVLLNVADTDPALTIDEPLLSLNPRPINGVGNWAVVFQTHSRQIPAAMAATVRFDLFILLNALWHHVPRT
jgi:hypothetical protein